MTFSTLRLCLLTVALAALPAPARAEAPAAGSRQAANVVIHESAGARLFDAGRYEDAIAEFRKAYELEARPGLLFRIGRAYERLGHANQALYFYRRFLATAPQDAAERAEAEAIVAAALPPPPEASPDEAASVEDGKPMLQVSAAPAPAEPIYHHWWFWAAAGAAAVAGVALGFAVWGDRGGDVPRSELGHKRFD